MTETPHGLLDRLERWVDGVVNLDAQDRELFREVRDALARVSVPTEPPQFRQRVGMWLLKCFGERIATDKIERNHRFLEEALEVVQSNGCTQNEAHQLVDYVYSRPMGELPQEVGGALVTLAALCSASGVDMSGSGAMELARIEHPDVLLKIREKQKAKPEHSPLAAVVAPPRPHTEQK